MTAAAYNVEDLVRHVPLAVFIRQVKNIVELQRMAFVLQRDLAVHDDDDAPAHGRLTVNAVLLEGRLGETKVCEAGHDSVHALHLLALPRQHRLGAVDTGQLRALGGEEVVVVLHEARADILEGHSGALMVRVCASVMGKKAGERNKNYTDC